VKPRGAPSSPERHYSYTVYADPAVANTFDDRRFGGPIGELVASSQARVITGFLTPVRERTVLDVGTGTGRAAVLLARAGARVTGIDASEEMLAVARRRAAADGVDARFETGDAHALPFPDRSFEDVVCLRVLMHTPAWRECVAELCRVADRFVVVDYPSARSMAVVESLGRRIVHAAGLRTEPYRVFTHRAIAEALGGCGFRVRASHRQFVLPISFHKAIGSRGFTESSERLLDGIGLLRWFGSPVTLLAERCASS